MSDTVQHKIKNSDADGLKQLTRDIYADPELRAAWAADESIWRALLDRMQTISSGTSSMSSNTDLTLAVLMLANNLAACAVAGKKALSSGFLGEFVNLEFPTSLHKYVYQIMANLSIGFNASVSSQAQQLLTEGLQSSSVDYTSMEDKGTAFALLILHKNMILAIEALDDESCDAIVSLWGPILEESSRWFSAPEKNEMLIREAMELAVHCFSRGIFPRLVAKYGGNPLLLRYFATILENASADEDEREEARSSENIVGSMDVLVQVLLRDLSCFIPSLSLLPGLRVIEELRVFISLAKIVPEIARTKQELLEPIIEALKVTKRLPAKSKMNGKSDNRPAQFPSIRCHLIDSLTELVMGNLEAQNTTRENGGLAAVLECCMIDENNPFMKEHAILCIRYLLQDNKANQQFVAAMEAKQAVDPEALAKAGYETEIRNGKISIKHI